MVAITTTTTTSVNPVPTQNRPAELPQSPSLEKYRRIEKSREPTPDDEIRVMGTGRVGKYVTYAAKLFKEQQRQSLTIRATGKAISIAVSVCEVIKRRFKGLHQMTIIGWTEIVDEYEPLEAGLERRSEKRTVVSISIVLTFDETKVDTKAIGYQAPIDESLVEERDTVALIQSGTRGRRGTRRSGPRHARVAEDQNGSELIDGGARGARGGRRRYARRGGPSNPRGSSKRVDEPQSSDAIPIELTQA